MDEGWRRTDRASKRKTGFIYKLTCTVNGKAYIGLSMVAFKKRMQGHRSKALSGKREMGCRALNNAIRKYGWDAFTKEIIADGIPKAELGDVERAMIVAHGTKAPKGYNLSIGGELSPMLVPSIQERAREVMNSPEVVEKRAKVFASDGFKERVGKASKASWDGCSNEERKQRAESQIRASRIKAEDKREARIAGLPRAKGRSLWNGAKRLALEHAKRKAGSKDVRDIRDPVADTEAWFGPSFEERHYRGVARTSRSRPSCAGEEGMSDDSLLAESDGEPWGLG
jgi:group I intron endonuclease